MNCSFSYDAACNVFIATGHENVSQCFQECILFILFWEIYIQAFQAAQNSNGSGYAAQRSTSVSNLINGLTNYPAAPGTLCTTVIFSVKSGLAFSCVFECLLAFFNFNCTKQLFGFESICAQNECRTETWRLILRGTRHILRQLWKCVFLFIYCQARPQERNASCWNMLFLTFLLLFSWVQRAQWPEWMEMIFSCCVALTVINC